MQYFNFGPTNHHIDHERRQGAGYAPPLGKIFEFNREAPLHRQNL
jgi:hypothetical protein